MLTDSYLAMLDNITSVAVFLENTRAAKASCMTIIANNQPAKVKGKNTPDSWEINEKTKYPT